MSGREVFNVNTELRLLLEALPHETRPMVENLWNQLPADVRRESELTLGSFIKLIKHNPTSASDLLKIVQRTTAPMLQQASSVAIVGPVNVGKSTLYNALISRQKDKAACSPVPGTTKVNQYADAGLFELVDTPGADHGEDNESKERDEAFAAAENAQFLLIVFDATGSVTSSDRALYRRMLLLGKPHLVVLNKIDLIAPVHRKVVCESAARILDIALESVLPVSAQNTTGVDQLVLEITAAEPKLLLKVAETMPALRRKLAWQTIRRTAMLSALVGLTPLPLMDVIPLTLLQGNLVLTLARIYGNQLSVKSILELASTLGVGWLARLAFQELSKFGGVPGWILSASIAASATLTIGFSALSWFETGIKPDKQQIEQQAKSWQKRLIEGLKNLGKARPNKKRVTEELDKLLPTEPPAAVNEASQVEDPQS